MMSPVMTIKTAPPTVAPAITAIDGPLDDLLAGTGATVELELGLTNTWIDDVVVELLREELAVEGLLVDDSAEELLVDSDEDTLVDSSEEEVAPYLETAIGRVKYAPVRSPIGHP